MQQFLFFIRTTPNNSKLESELSKQKGFESTPLRRHGDIKESMTQYTHKDRKKEILRHLLNDFSTCFRCDHVERRRG